MAKENVKTLLLVTSFGSDSLFPFLFEFTKYWASQGRQLLYVSKSEIQALPPSLAGTGRPDPNILKLMQFMYLPSWKDLFYQLATIHTRRFEVQAVIVDNLADYFSDESDDDINGDFTSHVCATLLFASLLTFQKVGGPVALVCGYASECSTIERNIVKNFFHNIWEVKKSATDNKETKFTISKLSLIDDEKIISFSYIDHHDQMLEKDRSNVQLDLIEIIKKVVNE